MPPSTPHIWIRLEKEEAEALTAPSTTAAAVLTRKARRSALDKLVAALNQPAPDPSKAQELAEKVAAIAEAVENDAAFQSKIGHGIRSTQIADQAATLNEAAGLLTALPALSREDGERLIDIAQALEAVGIGDEPAAVGMSRYQLAQFARNLASRASSGGEERGLLSEGFAPETTLDDCHVPARRMTGGGTMPVIQPEEEQGA